MKAKLGRLWINKDEYLEGTLYYPGADEKYEISGELTFTTGMTGYPETMTDPSFAGQFICFTSPMLGNYSWEKTNLQSKKIHCRGIITQCTTDKDFIKFCISEGIPVFTNTDTRKITLDLRANGARISTLTTDTQSFHAPESTFDYEQTNWAEVCSGYLNAPYDTINAPIALWDLGAKQSIYNNLVKTWGSCAVLPASATSEDILKYPRLMISNGPGDPSKLTKQISVLKEVVGKIPIQAICLGHQLAALAVGAKVSKLKFGHRGMNHPVQHLPSKKVLITSQNHGYAVDAGTLPSGAVQTFKSLFDGSCEGFTWADKKIHTAQFHPEAAPGPEDASVLFKEFYDLYS